MTNETNGNHIILSSNYSGQCKKIPLTNDDLLRLTSQQEDGTHYASLFALKYRILPCMMMPSTENVANEYNDMFTFNWTGQFSVLNRGKRWSGKRKQGGIYHATSSVNFLIDQYEADPNTFLYNSNYDTYDDKGIMSSVYIDLGNYLSVFFYGGLISPVDVDNPNQLQPDDEDKSFMCFSGIRVYHVPQSTQSVKTLLQQLTKFKLYPTVEATLQMVCQDERHGFYTSAIRMKKPLINDLKLHYGDHFTEIHEELLEIIQEKDSTGITFLHGSPGMGKTYYLRYLINEIKDKTLIYVPPDLVNEMTKPGFLPFLMQHPNSILIVEDAENIIRDRKDENLLPNQAVANLLNLSDGLLGDAMHQQIICTFNCDVKGIDPALLRDGRLVIEHKFDKLSVENARRLCVELGITGNGEDIHEPISLAEIYARKNAGTDNLTNGTNDNGQTTTKAKRSLKKKSQQPEHLFGFYS